MKIRRQRDSDWSCHCYRGFEVLTNYMIYHIAEKYQKIELILIKGTNCGTKKGAFTRYFGPNSTGGKV